MNGIIDNVKIRVRTHNPSEVDEQEFNNIEEAVYFLQNI